MSRKPSATNSTTRNRRNPRAVRARGPRPLSRNQRRLRSRVRRLQASARAPEPTVLEPVVLEPVVQEPVVEEPVVEEPVVEEPVVEEPVVEEPRPRPGQCAGGRDDPLRQNGGEGDRRGRRWG